MMQSHFNRDRSQINSCYPVKQNLERKTQFFAHNNISTENLNWWIEIITSQPYCIYYFGPFTNMREAVSHHDGYIEDLKDDGVKGQNITSIFKRCQPKYLTVFDD
jgi:Domain of unknown function (DUF1816)